MIKVHVWYGSKDQVAVGHAAMELSDGTYISWWPSQPLKQSDTNLVKGGSALVANCVPAYRNRRFRDDVSDEGRDPDVTIPLPELREADMKKYWLELQSDGTEYNLVHFNCSTVVYKVLEEGGALDFLSYDDKQKWNRTLAWTPGGVEEFCKDINRTTGAATGKW